MCLVGRIEKWRDEKLICLVGKKIKRIKCIVCVNLLLYPYFIYIYIYIYIYISKQQSIFNPLLKKKLATKKNQKRKRKKFNPNLNI